MEKTRRQPQRTCIGCRQSKGQGQLIRFVRSPDGQILVDLRGKLPGRGAYACCSLSCLEAAVQKRQFERAFSEKCLPVTAGQVRTAITDELQSQMSALLGMARKSAQFVAGSNQVLAALGKLPLQIVVLGSDISPQIGDKVKAKADKLGVETVYLFDKSELGRILGRAVRSVVGLPVGQLADAFVANLVRYQDISGEN